MRIWRYQRIHGREGLDPQMSCRMRSMPALLASLHLHRIAYVGGIDRPAMFFRGRKLVQSKTQGEDDEDDFCRAEMIHIFDL